MSLLKYQGRAFSLIILPVSFSAIMNNYKRNTLMLFIYHNIKKSLHGSLLLVLVRTWCKMPKALHTTTVGRINFFSFLFFVFFFRATLDLDLDLDRFIHV